MDINSLVYRAKKGDGSAYWELIEPKKENLYRIAFCYVKNEEDALDIVSETIYRGLLSIGKLKIPEYFYTWLTRILINCAINHLKKVKPLSSTEREIPDSTVTEELDRAQVMDLYQAIDQLDSKHKSVIILKYIEDLTLAQTAEILNMPVGTVKTYLNRALKKLKLDLREVM
ncbi:MAG TPA: sigma-70 family RNA polymerase sigma factor [Clostridiales bacterium]|nr:sigma-70 family RNA polymerase sigma factor [Clostridiales bacterium]